MSLIKLEFYTIRLHERGNPESYQIFDDIFEDVPFVEFFKKFITKFTDGHANKYEKKTFKFQSNSTRLDSGNRIISGVIKGGNFGTSSEVENVVTGEEKEPITKNDSIINPFYYLVYFPEKSSTGLLIIQKTGLDGVFSEFRTYFKTFINNQIEDLVLETAPYATKEMLIKMIEVSKINQVILKKYNNSSDKFNNFRDRIGNADKLNAQFILSSSDEFPNFVKDKVLKYVNNPNANFFEIKELDSLGFNGKVETSVKLESDGRSRIVVLNDVEKFKLSFDVTDYVIKDTNNHPTFDSIDKEAKDLLNQHFNV